MYRYNKKQSSFHLNKNSLKIGVIIYDMESYWDIKKIVKNISKAGYRLCKNRNISFYNSMKLLLFFITISFFIISSFLVNNLLIIN